MNILNGLLKSKIFCDYLRTEAKFNILFHAKFVYSPKEHLCQVSGSGSGPFSPKVEKRSNHSLSLIPPIPYTSDHYLHHSPSLPPYNKPLSLSWLFGEATLYSRFRSPHSHNALCNEIKCTVYFQLFRSCSCLFSFH